MLRFQSIAAALLAIQPSCSRFVPDNLRAIRRLSYEKIAGYEPESQVTDHQAIDLDQAELEVQLAASTDESFANAKSIYQDGGHSKSFAQVNLSSALSTVLSKGTAITGTAVDGSQVVGKAMTDVPAGSTSIPIQYATTDIVASYVNCQVGALSGFGAENTAGCFASNSTINIDGMGGYTYTYDILNDNNNGRTIAGFSTSAESKMYQCGDGCPHNEYQKYYDYYGAFDYANEWVLAALDGKRTAFKNGNADFSTYSYTGRAEAAKKGTAYMNIYMYVIREFEDAIADCKAGCINCNDDPVHAWDEGVAFYTGTLEGQDGSGEGKLMYALADKRCANYKTCGTKGDSLQGTSKANYDLSSLFAMGQHDLLVGNCDAVRGTVDRITDLMAVPLIQGTLRYAYKVENLQGDEKEKAEGAVFAASVVPRLAACNADDAATVSQNMGVGATSTDFSAVRNAFEKNYGCLNITCADIGGLWSEATGSYYEGASPCQDTTSSTSSASASSSMSAGEKTGIVLGSIAGAVAVAALVGVCFLVRREKQGKPVFSGEGKSTLS